MNPASLLQAWIAAIERVGTRIPALALTVGERAWPAALVGVAAGLALVVIGTRLGPVLSGAAGGLVGWLAATQFYVLAGGWHIPVATVGWTSAAVLGLASLFAPVIYPMALGAIAGALVGLRLSIGGGGAVGAAVGALLLAGAAILLRRFIMAATAAAAGATLFVASLIALSVRFSGLEALTNRPALLIGVGALLAVAGTAFQFGVQHREAPNLMRERRPRALARD